MNKQQLTNAIKELISEINDLQVHTHNPDEYDQGFDSAMEWMQSRLIELLGQAREIREKQGA